MATTFPQLCDALSRNDPNVTTLLFDIYEIPNNSDIATATHRLGWALQSNTMVSTISLNMGCLLNSHESDIDDDVAAPLLQWLGASPSLTTVRLGSPSYVGPRRELFPISIVSRVFQAMATNPNIRKITSGLSRLPWTIVAEYLQATRAPLESLLLHGSGPGNRQGMDGAMEASLAIGALALKELTFVVNEEMLQLFQSPRTTPLFATLRELEVKFHYWGDFDGAIPSTSSLTALLSTALTVCTNLTQFCLNLAGDTMNAARWSHIATGLRSNPSIEHVVLWNCPFTKDATARFLRDLGSTDVATQHVRKLVLGGDTKLKRFDRQGDPLELSQLFRNSLLDHITLGSSIVRRARMNHLFNDLVANVEHVLVSSICLECIDRRELPLVGQFLAHTIHLRTLSLELDDRYDDEAARLAALRVPNSFLSGLCRNGSVQAVEIAGYDEGNVSATTLDFVDMVTRRNRLLSPAIASTQFHDDADETNETTDMDDLAMNSETALPLAELEGRRAPAQQFPTMGQVAMQAERMSPNTLLMGLNAATIAIGRGNDDNDHDEPA